MGEWVPLYITFFLGIVLFTIVPSVVGSFCDIDGFLENPNFSPVGCEVNDYATFISPIVNFIANGLIIPLGLLDWLSLSNGIAINPFSLFGLAPNNALQTFLGQSLSAFAFLPERMALMSIALFFLGLIYSIARLVRG